MGNLKKSLIGLLAVAMMFSSCMVFAEDDTTELDSSNVDTGKWTQIDDSTIWTTSVDSTITISGGWTATVPTSITVSGDKTNGYTLGSGFTCSIGDDSMIEEGKCLKISVGSKESHEANANVKYDGQLHFLYNGGAIDEITIQLQKSGTNLVDGEIVNWTPANGAKSATITGTQADENTPNYTGDYIAHIVFKIELATVSAEDPALPEEPANP